MSNLLPELPIEEYFRYHPPKTEERKAAHDRVNRITLELCLRLADMDVTDGNCERQNDVIDSYELIDLCEEPECRNWIAHIIKDLKIFLRGRQMFNEQALSNAQARSEIMMRIQQIRMFANQGITLDELRKLEN